MPIVWTPSGTLDVSTDPCDLPEQVDGKTAVSGAMTRCTNLELDRQGIARTRRGSAKVNSTSMDGPPTYLAEQGGKRYAFTSQTIYEDEVAIATDLNDSGWTGVKFTTFTDESWQIYATNSIDRKRVEDGAVYDWGLDAPEYAPELELLLYSVSFAWENDDYYGTREVGVKVSDYDFTYDWEEDYLESSGLEDVAYICSFDWEKDFILELADDSSYKETNEYFNIFDFELGITQEEADVVEWAKYGVVYTYCRYYGDTLICESNPSPVAYCNRASGIIIKWDASAAPADVTHVRIYRSLADVDGVWYLDNKYDISDEIAPFQKRDAALGVSAPSDHDPPPTGITHLWGPAFNGVLFGLVGNRVYFSKPGEPEYWPPTYYIEIGSPQHPLVSGTVFAGQAYTASQHQLYSIGGTGADTFTEIPLGSTTGTFSANFLLPVKGTGVFHLGSDGIYLFTAGKDESFSDGLFKPVFEGYDAGLIEGIDKSQIEDCWAIEWEGCVYIGYCSTTATHPDNILRIDLQTTKVSHIQYPYEISCVAIDYSNRRLLAGTLDGDIYELEKFGATQDDTTNITWQVQTKDFIQFEQYFPKWARYDVELGTGATCTGSILLADAIKQYHTVSLSRNRKKRLITSCTGPRLAVRLSGAGPVSIYGLEVM